MIIYNIIRKHITHKLKEKGYFVKKERITAVHDDDLIDFLRSLGIYEKVINHECFCYYCKAEVTIENTQGVFTKEGEILFCCNGISCYEMLLKKED
jgi:hypothetical protein